MQEQIALRLTELRQEYANGQRMLTELEARQASLRETMLRISGAIQVLEELLTAGEQDISTDGNLQAELQPTAEVVST